MLFICANVLCRYASESMHQKMTESSSAFDEKFDRLGEELQNMACKLAAVESAAGSAKPVAKVNCFSPRLDPGLHSKMCCRHSDIAGTATTTQPDNLAWLEKRVDNVDKEAAQEQVTC